MVFDAIPLTGGAENAAGRQPAERRIPGVVFAAQVGERAAGGGKRGGRGHQGDGDEPQTVGRLPCAHRVRHERAV